MISTALTLLLVLIGISIPVGAALGLLGLILDPMFSMLPLTRAMGEISWSTNNEFLLVAIPLFIMLGEILLRSGLQENVNKLVDDIWEAAAVQTQQGFDCNTGAEACPFPVKGKMVLVEPSDADRELLKQVLNDAVLPKWAARCSAQCVEDFNATVGKELGVVAKK